MRTKKKQFQSGILLFFFKQMVTIIISLDAQNDDIIRTFQRFFFKKTIKQITLDLTHSLYLSCSQHSKIEFSTNKIPTQF